MAKSSEEIRMQFSQPVLGGMQIADTESMRYQFMTLAENLNQRLPENRTKALAMTNLEQAMMWALKSIAEGGKE